MRSAEPPIDQHFQMKPNQNMAKQLAVRALATLVFDAVNLEGVAITLPEVQTLLDGITVGGHKISDQNMALNQAETWRVLFELTTQGKFSFCKAIALKLHAIAGKEEAMSWGEFRTDNVTISGTEYRPPSAENLNKIWQKTTQQVAAQPDIYDRAICAFLLMARAQFFGDVNRRLGRFMMNGILLSAGYPIINVQAKQQQVFNEKMARFYNTGNMTEMNQFLRTCLDQHLIDNFKSLAAP